MGCGTNLSPFPFSTGQQCWQMKMTVSPFSSVAIIAQGAWRNFFFDLAEETTRRHGSKVHLYCGSALEQEHYVGQDRDRGAFASINIMTTEIPGKAPEVSDEEGTYSLARQNEIRLGVTYNTFIVANRHLGRGYAPGGFYHPRSPLSETTSYPQSIQIYNNIIEYWEGEISGKNISLILNAKSPVVVAVASSLDVPVRTMFEGRHKTLYHWAYDEKETNPLIEEAYATIGDDLEEVRLSAPPQSYVLNREKLLKQFSPVSGLIKRIYATVREHVYNTYKGKKEGRYLLGSDLRYTIRHWYGSRVMARRNGTTLKEIKNRPFVFFPLHVEPEIAMQGKSPEFLVQLAAIISLSRNLPAGTLLAVKEHLIAIGRRPRDFYNQISELKNVVLLDTHELGVDVIRHAKVVATITGTAGMEAATIGKPVITFGRHNIYSFLPHVFELTDEVQLKSYLDISLRGDFDEAVARTNGAKFMAAIKTIAFDLEGYSHLTTKGYSKEGVVSAIDTLEASIYGIGANAENSGTVLITELADRPHN
jgi:hypothetical protein